MNRFTPKIPLVVGIAALAFTACTHLASADDYAYTPGYAPAPPVAPVGQAAAYSADQLDQMLGPIALYPDPLLSQVLAAATYPQDIATASEFLQNHPSPSEDDLNGQSWDASVKAIAHFPDVVQLLAGNMDWTQALGAAFASQPQDVMDSIQRLRTQAQNNHALATTPQQEVLSDNGVIQILPAQPNVIYVPQYDPGIVYYTPNYNGSYLTFGNAYPYGSFFDLDFDFRNHRFLRGGHFDHDNHRFDFGRGDNVWHHDPRRPIVTPVRPFVPPHTRDPHRGFGQPGRPPTAFHPPIAPRGNAPRPVTPRPQRPVTGLPHPTVRPQAPRPVPPRVAPVQPRPQPVPIRPAPRPAPVAPRVERPVQGLPARPAPVAPRPAPAPRAPMPAPRAPSAPAFHPGGGGAPSARGNSSMHHR